jgi:hypothetical protein
MADESMETAATTDDELTAAAADATKEAEVEEQAVEEEAAVEEETAAEEEEQETDDDGLPLDHGARSELGRKVAASHRRMDEFGAKIEQFDSRLDKLLSVMEKMQPEEEEIELDPDMPLTYGEYQKLEELRERKRMEQQSGYDQDYMSVVTEMAGDLEPEFAEAVMTEMRENVRYQPSKDGKKDALSNFMKATQLAIKKRTAAPKRRNPLEDNKDREVPGTLKGQVVTKHNKPLPKLDAKTEDYLKYITATRGEEAAMKMRKSLAE